MIILGIETTCDETGVALVRNGTEVILNVVATSAALHKKYGGIVPEVAAREQIRTIVPSLKEAVAKTNVIDIDAIAVANGPGLIGSLLIGVETAKTLAFAWNKPLFAVNHLVGHIYSNWLKPTVKPQNLGIEFPLIALVVSGGHTDLVLMKNHGNFKLIGTTLDDAAGEAFDKVAKTLGLSYPGGPEIEKGASRWKNSKAGLSFPRPMIGTDNFNFSFSGLKTSVVNYMKDKNLDENETDRVAFEFQEAATDVLVYKTTTAAKKFNCKSVVIGGGVAANERLREKMALEMKFLGIDFFSPSKENSVDNGAMIAAAAFFSGKKIDLLKLQANAALHF